MDDFLYILKLQLEGRLSDEQITDQMHIYEDYIQEQLAGGKTMEQVMRKLGDPEKVADMIVEHYEKLERQQQRENIGNMTADEINANVYSDIRNHALKSKKISGGFYRMKCHMMTKK